MRHHFQEIPFGIPNSIQELAAPQLLGVVWNWCLYGALVVQFYVYSYNFSQDNRHLKLLVYGVFFLETVQTALSLADLYYWFAVGFGNVFQLTMPFASFVDVPIMGSVVSLSVQFFFVYRIWLLSEKQSWWLCVVICLLSVVSAIGAFVGGIVSYFMDEFIAGISLEVFEMTWIVGNALSDLLIASAMLYYLRKIWVRDGNLSSHILVSIVRLTVETNLVTTTVSIAALLMVAVYPEKNWYVCPTYILGKLYSNTLLVSLNSRIAIRDTYETRGAVVNRHVVTRLKSTACPETTRDTIILEPEKSRTGLMKQLPSLPEGEAEERVNTPATEDIV